MLFNSTNVSINGGTITNAFGGGESTDVTVKTNITLNGSVTNLYGGSNSKGIVETTDVNCPTCDIPFKKYIGEGLLSRYQFICPACKARYEYDGSYKFMNIPDTNSKLWEHYQEKMTMMGYTIILNKKNLDKTNEYECKFFETDINESYPHLMDSLGKIESKLIYSSFFASLYLSVVTE